QMRTHEVREEQKRFLKNSKDSRPVNFFKKFKYRSKKSGYLDYGLRLSESLQDNPTSEKLLNLKKKWDANEYMDDWDWYEDEKSNRKADRKVKKRKRQAHIAFHENLDERLDGKKLFCINAEDEEDETTVIS
ncbi:4949_t:CDS:2, partial [Dentiscutata heterogama]